MNLSNNMLNKINKGFKDIYQGKSFGKIQLSDDSFYEGELYNNEFCGKGVLKTKNYIYKGEFKNNLKEGKGKFNDLIKNSMFEGFFKNDVPEGFGFETYADGSMFQGYYQSGLKEGIGKLILKIHQSDINSNESQSKNQESIYIGNFHADKLSGFGKFKWTYNKIYYGEWDNNEIQGFGCLIDGKVKHIGFFEHDKKNGYGSSFYISEKFILLGKWEEDLIEGPGIIFPLNDECDGEIRNEKIVGMCRGDIINTNLSDEDINLFLKSEDYKSMVNLFKNKFWFEFIKNKDLKFDDISVGENNNENS